MEGSPQPLVPQRPACSRRALLLLSLVVGVCLIYSCRDAFSVAESDGVGLIGPLAIVGNVSSADEVRRRRLPDAVIIGVRKCGTRAMLRLLQMHPDVETKRHQETHFFDRNESFALGLDWYRSQMPPTLAGQLTVEKTPGYFTSELAPRRLFSALPHAKLILLVRDPLVRLISDFTQLRAKQSTEQPRATFEQSVFMANGSLNTRYYAVRNSLYARHLRRWLRWFPRASLLLLDGDNLIVNPVEEVRRAERFLGLRASISSADVFYSTAKGFYCFRKDGKRTSFRCLGKTKGRKHEFVSERTLDRLKRLFQPYNKAFFALSGRVFPSW